MRESGQLEEAIAVYRRGIALNPSLPEAHHNLAMALLRRGDFQQGWEEYEWRWKCKEHFVLRRENLPSRNGMEADSKVERFCFSPSRVLGIPFNSSVICRLWPDEAGKLSLNVGLSCSGYSRQSLWDAKSLPPGKRCRSLIFTVLF